MISFLGTVLGDIGFDAVLSEDTEQTSQVTRHPVEFGAEVSDHVYTEPVTLKIQGGVSNLLLQPGRPDDPFGAAFSSQGSRMENAYDALDAIQRAGEPFTVQTLLGRWDSMILSGLRVTQDARTSKVLFFTATLVEAIIVESEIVGLPASRLQAPEDASQSDAGRTPAVNSSILNTIIFGGGQ